LIGFSPLPVLTNTKVSII